MAHSTIQRRKQMKRITKSLVKWLDEWVKECQGTDRHILKSMNKERETATNNIVAKNYN